MREKGYTYEKARKLLYSKRPIIQPNIFFSAQLKEYEKTALEQYINSKKTEIVKKDEEEKSIEKYKFLCSKCRTLIFKSEDLAVHSTGKAICQTYFIELQSWMKIGTSPNNGNIKCPNIKVFFYNKISIKI